jgi:hypothetical protein
MNINNSNSQSNADLLMPEPCAYVLYFSFTWKMSKGQKNKSIAQSCSSEGDLKLISLHFNILFLDYPQSGTERILIVENVSL